LISFKDSGILKVHKWIVDSVSGDPTVLHKGLVESAALRPDTVLTEENKMVEIYPDAISKAVALAYALIKWHSFLDGNKRTGVFCMAFMLERNGIVMAFPPYIVKYSVQVATETITEEEFKRLITKLCSTDPLNKLWNQVRYELIPNNYLRIIGLIARKTHSKFLLHHLIEIVIDWFGAGFPAIARQLMEEMLQVNINPNVALDLTPDDFMVK